MEANCPHSRSRLTSTNHHQTTVNQQQLAPFPGVTFFVVLLHSNPSNSNTHYKQDELAKCCVLAPRTTSISHKRSLLLSFGAMLLMQLMLQRAAAIAHCPHATRLQSKPRALLLLLLLASPLLFRPHSDNGSSSSPTCNPLRSIVSCGIRLHFLWPGCAERKACRRSARTASTRGVC